MQVSELFADLPGHESRTVLSAARSRNFVSREVVFLAGDPAKEVFLLASGWVKVTQVSGSGLEVILRIDPPGEIIGTFGPGAEGKHTSTAQALEECEMLVWDSASFESLLERFPLLRRNMGRILERRLSELEVRLCEISTETVSPRLAHALIRLLGRMGRKTNGHVEINLSQEALAQMTAMTSFTVSRVLSKWEQQGLVSLRRGALIVRNYEGLLSLCKGGSLPEA